MQLLSQFIPVTHLTDYNRGDYNQSNDQLRVGRKSRVQAEKKSYVDIGTKKSILKH